MKVLFILPRLEPNTNPPLGLGYVAAYIKQYGYEVEILDPTFENKNFVYDRLKKDDYDVIGINAFTMSYNLGLDFASYAKKIKPSCKVVFGGIHPTILFDEVIASPVVDFVVIGEGEISMLELLKEIEGGQNYSSVDGICYKDNGKITQTNQRKLISNLDIIPFPARELLPMNKYLKANNGRSAWAVSQPSTNIITSRGCPFHCTYCSSNLVFGYRCRYRSVDNILDEIEFLIHTYHIRGLSIVDDTFIISKKHIYEFVEKIKDRKLKFEFICNGRVDTIDKDVMKALKDVGCKGIAFGVESGSQFVLDNILKKGIKLEQVEKAFNWAYQVGIPTDGYFMIGIPGETEEDIKKTIAFSQKIKASAANFSITIPMPKTDLWDIALKYGEITATSYDEYNYSGKTIYKSNLVSQEKLNMYQKKAIRSFYFRFGFICNQVLSIRSKSDLIQKIKGFYMLIKSL